MGLTGSVDQLTDRCIAGWAADDADFDRPVHVDVLVNGITVATLAATQFREDLRAAGIGDGFKAFRFDPDALLRPGRNRLAVRYAGTEVHLPRGEGHWVTPRTGGTAWQTAFVAALEAYHEFQPADHICVIGNGHALSEYALRQMGVPFGRFTRLAQGAPHNADVLICWTIPSADVLAGINPGGLAAIGVSGASPEPGPEGAQWESIVPETGLPATFAMLAAGREQSPQAPPAPVLAHIHVPKCAGTSFRAMLERYFGPRHLHLYIDDTYFVYGDEAVRSHLQRHPDARGFSSHHVRSFPRWLAGREMLYITFLRDPVDQFVSYMTHVRKFYSRITATTLLEAVPPAAPDWSLRDFARWLLTSHREIPFRENHNVNFFARHSAPAAGDRLRAARAALENFLFVGLTERMEESVVRLQALAASRGIDFPPGPAPFENTSADCRDDVTWIHPGDEVGAMLLRSVELDRQLYRWAAERFDAMR